MLSKDLPRSSFRCGNFFHWFAPRSGLAFAPQVCFLPRKTSWKREQQSKEKRMYRKGDGHRTRDNAKRETGGGEGWCPYRLIYAGGRSATMGENDQKRRAIWRLLSFSSHCSPLSLLFTFPVPRSPFSELHAPNPTSDPHKGRRGRNTFGKSSSTPLQRIRRVSQKSLVPRYVCFSDSLGGEGAQAEWETDSSNVWSISRDVWCES